MFNWIYEKFFGTSSAKPTQPQSGCAKNNTEKDKAEYHWYDIYVIRHSFPVERVLATSHDEAKNKYVALWPLDHNAITKVVKKEKWEPTKYE